MEGGAVSLKSVLVWKNRTGTVTRGVWENGVPKGKWVGVYLARWELDGEAGDITCDLWWLRV